MADHLPECSPEYHDYGYCICDRLRQAEQRGMLAQAVVEMDTSVINQNSAYDKGYAAGLKDVQRAVDAVVAEWEAEWSIDDIHRAIDKLKGTNNAE